MTQNVRERINDDLEGIYIHENLALSVQLGLTAIELGFKQHYLVITKK